MPRTNSNDHKGQVIPLLLNSSFFFNRGIKAYEKGRLDQAIYYIERAMELEPREPVFPCQLAIFLAEKGQYEKANELLEKVVHEIDPTMYECYFFLANNYAHLGNFHLAKHYLNQYIQKDPEGEFSEDAHTFLFMLNDEIADEYDEGIEIEEMMKFMHIIDPLHRGEFAVAENEARITIGETPNEWDAYAYLAEALIYQGKIEEGKYILQNLISKWGSHFIARCIYIMLLVKEGDEKAPVWVKSLENLHPISDWHRYYLAKTLFFVGEYEKADLLFEKLAWHDLFHHSPIFLHQRAVVACKNGRDEFAKDLWEKLRQIDKNNAVIADDFIYLLEENKLFAYENEQLFIYAPVVAK